MALSAKLSGERNEIARSDKMYPEAFSRLKKPPKTLYTIGNPDALEEGLAIVGARLATPYGIGCSTKFGKIASSSGITIISGGARGCDSAAHEAALACKGKTVVFLGGGCDEIYPKENLGLFQMIIDNGGVIASESSWSERPQRYLFRERNRLIASLAKATLIVEAGLPSGTFSTADEALAAGRDVLVVPGSITSRHSHGANRLIYQGATPIIDEETFYDQLASIFNTESPEKAKGKATRARNGGDALSESLIDMINSQPCTSDDLLSFMDSRKSSPNNLMWLLQWLSDQQRQGKVARYPDGRYGPAIV